MLCAPSRQPNDEHECSIAAMTCHAVISYLNAYLLEQKSRLDPVWIASPCDDKFIFPLCNFRFSGKRWEKQLKPVKRREIKCQKHNSRKCTRFAENSKRCFHNKCEKISFCLSLPQSLIEAGEVLRMTQLDESKSYRLSLQIQ